MDHITQRAAADIVARTVSDGGCTYEAKTLLVQTWTNGYAVAVGGVTIPAAEATPEAIAWLSNAVAGEFMTTYAGTWLQDGVLYIDAVRYIADRDRAIALGQEHGQQAVYGWAEKEAIPC